jgi:hypothetical protein
MPRSGRARRPSHCVLVSRVRPERISSLPTTSTAAVTDPWPWACPARPDCPRRPCAIVDLALAHDARNTGTQAMAQSRPRANGRRRAWRAGGDRRVRALRRPDPATRPRDAPRRPACRGFEAAWSAARPEVERAGAIACTAGRMLRLLPPARRGLARSRPSPIADATRRRRTAMRARLAAADAARRRDGRPDPRDARGIALPLPRPRRELRDLSPRGRCAAAACMRRDAALLPARRPTTPTPPPPNAPGRACATIPPSRCARRCDSPTPSLARPRRRRRRTRHRATTRSSSSPGRGAAPRGAGARRRRRWPAPDDLAGGAALTPFQSSPAGGERDERACYPRRA